MRLGWPARLAALSLGALLASGLATSSVATSAAATLAPSPADSGLKDDERGHPKTGGFSGYQIVFELHGDAPLGQARHVYCPEGKKVLGGGATVKSPPGVAGALEKSAPYHGNIGAGEGWVASWTAPGVAYDTTAALAMWAVSAKVD